MTRVLVDTSVWVDHFRNRNNALAHLIELDMALVHPMVILEIACGTPPAPREQTLSNLKQLQSSEQARLSDVMTFIDNENLYGLGCGLVDMVLLVSALITPGAVIWTMDKRLERLATQFNVSFQPVFH